MARSRSSPSCVRRTRCWRPGRASVSPVGSAVRTTSPMRWASRDPPVLTQNTEQDYPMSPQSQDSDQTAPRAGRFSDFFGFFHLAEQKKVKTSGPTTRKTSSAPATSSRRRRHLLKYRTRRTSAPSIKHVASWRLLEMEKSPTRNSSITLSQPGGRGVPSLLKDGEEYSPFVQEIHSPSQTDEDLLQVAG